MHILIEALSARVGGGVTRLLGTLSSFARVGPEHRYTLILSRRYQQALAVRVPTGIEVHFVDFGPGLLRRTWFLNVELPRLARRLNADVIYAAAEGAYLRSPLPMVMMAANMLLIEGNRRLLYRLTRSPFVRRAFKVASSIAFVSQTLRDAAFRAGLASQEKGFLVYHGVDRSSFSGGREPGDYYLAVSSIMAHKGYDVLIAAYAGLPEDYPPLRIVGGVGDPAVGERLLAEIEAHGLGSRVRLEGDVRGEDMPAIYRGARVLLFPSRVESFGLPLVEAMASGVPVIASDLPICREVCEDAVLYFQSGSAPALTERIRHLEGNPELSRHLAAAGIRRSAFFDWDQSTRLLVRQLERVASGQQLPGSTEAPHGGARL